MAKFRTGAIRVDGLAELSRALKSVDPRLQKELRAANKEAAEHVRDKAKARAYMVGGVAAHVAPSLRATAGAQSAGVSGGGAAHPAFGGAEFGARQYKQFKPWRGNGSGAGYFVYPTIRAEADNIVEPYRKATDRLIRKAFPK